MPRVLPRPKFKDDQLVVAFTSFAGESVPPPGVVKRGTKLMGSDPIVRSHPAYFVSADLPDNAWPSEYTYNPDPPAPGDDAVRVLDQLPDDQLLEATMDFSIGLGGDIVRKGTRLSKTDWRVQSAAEFFKPLA